MKSESMSILEEKTVCLSCHWQGTVGDCEPDVDGDGSLGCPVCNHVVKTVDRIAFDAWVDKRHRVGYNPAWNQYLIAELVGEFCRLGSGMSSPRYLFLRSVLIERLNRVA